MSASDLTPGTASVIGLGLIGGSVALALREAGWIVAGDDLDADAVAEALDRSVIDTAGLEPASSLTIVATPVDAIPEQVDRALEQTAGWVMDTGSVKAAIAAACSHARFVPSHPMAGSEQTGLAGARGELFRGAAWVLTPTGDTSDEGLAFAHDLLVQLGADPLTLRPAAHDRMVATISHVPHLAAAALMNVADRRADEHLAMLRLAAGGFRDMTRIAAGEPRIWPPICIQNADAITEAMDEVIETLGELRDAVASSDATVIEAELERARDARMNLPRATPLPPNLAEVRVRIKDRRGELAAVTGLAAELDVNIFDLEIAHSAEGPTGVIVLLVDATIAERLSGGLLARGYRPSIRTLS